ncbi:MAG: DNA repair protein RadC [Myxococcota bacterium]
MVADRPRERLRRLGTAFLSDAELLALVLRTGDARVDAETIGRDLIGRFDGLAGLACAIDSELEAVPGLGPAKAASLLAVVELGRRIAGPALPLGRVIRGPADVERYFRARLRQLDRECFHVVALDGRHRLLGTDLVSLGTLTASLVHPREVFRQAIRRAAGAVLVVHNHPSGDPRPSGEDRAVTRRLRDAGELLGIELLDHVIVGRSGYYSFREAADVLADRAGHS